MAETDVQANKARLIGTWKLVSAVREEVPSGEKTDLFGPDPVGFLNYSADGRMLTLIVRKNRKRPHGFPIRPDEAASLFRSLMSYGGTWELRGEEVFHYVDISANELWTGSEQQRFFKFDGDRLSLSTPVNPDPIDGKISVRRMIWVKVQ
jgi:hypothetical protein